MSWTTLPRLRMGTAHGGGAGEAAAGGDGGIKNAHLTPDLAAIKAAVDEIKAELFRQNRPSFGGAGIQDVAAERRRQISDEGFTSAHDDEHPGGTLAAAGAAYVLEALGRPASARDTWPFWPGKYKPGYDLRRKMVKAAALIIAEIDRIDRQNGGAS